MKKSIKELLLVVKRSRTFDLKIFHLTYFLAINNKGADRVEDSYREISYTTLSNSYSIFKLFKF